MSNYNPNCRVCQFIVYGTPIIASLVVFIGTLVVVPKAWWLALAVCLLMYRPVVKVGKMMPMLHEYFKEES